ncbi:MAG: hypothetical protein AB7O57_04620 [Hyphomicrobiaceae bacterium]
MLDCYPSTPQQGVCSTSVDDWARAICALLPPGFAFEAGDLDGALMHGRVRFLAHLMQLFNEQACALLLEFRCHTMEATAAQWDADYGLPDGCGINDVCAKIIARGDGRCESLAEMAEIVSRAWGDDYLMQLCCEELPPEIQAGAWDMGCDPMPPTPGLDGGGSELGFMSLGACSLPTDGADLGVHFLGPGACNIAGYPSVEAVLSSAQQPCIQEGCHAWEPDYGSTWLMGCREQPDIEGYVGTAHHLWVGPRYSSPVFTQHDWIETGSWDMGCDELCPPPIAALLCFLEATKHAHVKLLPAYFDADCVRQGAT